MAVPHVNIVLATDEYEANTKSLIGYYVFNDRGGEYNVKMINDKCDG
jgi:hypothetical protein